MDLSQAYRECERITWSQARNFAYGIRLLPPAKRRGLAAVYALARRIDDIGDGAAPAEQKIAALAAARRATGDLTASPDDPVLVALADVAARFPVPVEAFGELIDGCVADVRGTSYQTFEDLLHYCRCVAGSVGRLSLGIFGTSRHGEDASRLADCLGVALQLTNILRDVREDYQRGRVYLPAEDLAKFDIELSFLGGTTPVAPWRGGTVRPPVPPGPWTKLIDFEAERARDWYAAGMRLLPVLDRRSAACTGAMAGIYRKLLDRIAAEPAAVTGGRVSLSAGEKAVVAARALAGRIS